MVSKRNPTRQEENRGIVAVYEWAGWTYQVYRTNRAWVEATAPDGDKYDLGTVEPGESARDMIVDHIFLR